MKKLLTKVLAVAMLAGVLATGAHAASGDIKFEIKSTTKAPTLDGKVTQEEYGGNAPIVLDGSGKNTDGTWANTTWVSGEVIKYYYTWDKENLYVGITVEGDPTESQSGCPEIGSNTCPFGKCDCVQIGFNPGGIVNGTHPVLYCVGFTADGQAYVHGDAFHSLEDGKQTIDACDIVKGYSKKYSKDGLNYEVELVIPWDEICLNGAGRSGEGAKKFDMTGELKKIGDGYVLPIFLVYVDNNGSGGNVYCRSDSTTGNKWVAEEMGSLALVLKDATPTAPASSAATADGTSIALFAAIASAAAATIVLKKRK